MSEPKPHHRRRWVYMQTVTFAAAASYLLLAIIDTDHAEEWWWPYAILMTVLTGLTLLCYKACHKIGRRDGPRN